MEQVRIWEGVRGVVGGHEVSEFVVVAFEAERLGSWTALEDERGNRGDTYTFYRSEGGSIIVHIEHWSRWANELDSAEIEEYDSIESCLVVYRKQLENAGVVQRRVLTLDEWRANRKDRKEE